MSIHLERGDCITTNGSRQSVLSSKELGLAYTAWHVICYVEALVAGALSDTYRHRPQLMTLSSTDEQYQYLLYQHAEEGPPIILEGTASERWHHTKR